MKMTQYKISKRALRMAPFLSMMAAGMATSCTTDGEPEPDLEERQADPGDSEGRDVAPGTRNAGVRPTIVEGEYIVVFRPGVIGRPGAAVGGAAIAQVASSIQSVYSAEVRYVYQHAIQGMAVRISEDERERLESDERVDYIVPNMIMRAVDTQTDAPWGLDRIDQITLPLDTEYTYSSGGADAHVYVIDTGLYAEHNDFTGRVLPGYDFIDNDPDPADCNGHGTHVAGTAVGTSYGVAKEAYVHGVRVLDCYGNGTVASVIAGMDWVTANAVAPAVANMSLQGGFSQAINDAVENSIAAGITYAIAAGNGYASDACDYSPSSTPNALTVASSTITDSRSDFSNIGPCVDLFAPGSGVLSAWIGDPDASTFLDGTSMATPHVAGVAALVREGDPSATPAEVMAAILEAATPDLIADVGTGTPNLLLHMSELGNPSRGRFSADDTGTCSDTIEVTLRDADLIGAGTQNITVTTSTLDTETVVLTEEPGGEGLFLGALTFAEGAAVPGDGVVQVEHGVEVQLTYTDADTGSGESEAITRTIDVDCEPPELTNIRTSFVTGSSADVTADASEPASIVVEYGTSCDDLSQTTAPSGLSLTPTAPLGGLMPTTQYYYVVTATDAEGNSAFYDGGGSCYTFTTPTVVFSEPFDDGTGTFTPEGGMWHHATACADSLEGHSRPGSLYYGQDTSCTYDDGTSHNGVARSIPITVDLSTAAVLSFDYFLETEGGTYYDRASVEVSIDGGEPVVVASSFETGEPLVGGTQTWQPVLIDLTSLGVGQVEIEILARFDTVDSVLNEYAGFYIDDVEVANTPAAPCDEDADCDDGVECTTESCDDVTGVCVREANHEVCGDGVFCNGVEACTASGCVTGAAPSCEDEIFCTIDYCDAEIDACVNYTEHLYCDNGYFCDGTEVCSPELGCVYGEPACEGGTCDEYYDVCIGVCGDGFLDPGEACDDGNTTPGDGCDELCQIEPPSGDLVTEIIVHSDWYQGYCTMFEITNEGDEPTSSWTIVMDMNGTAIQHLWNANRTGNTGEITLTPLSWNAVIQPGTTNYSIGFCATRPNGGNNVAEIVSSVGVY